MPASRATMEHVIEILDEEIGREKAVRIFNRLCQETRGNVSYSLTINRILDELQNKPKRKPR